MIKRQQVSTNKLATYAKVVVDKVPKEEEVNQTQITVGGDQLEFQGDTSTETTVLETAKMVFNNVVSTPDAKIMTINISNMHLNTPLQEYQYMTFNIKMIPQEVIDHYNLQNKVTADTLVYCEIHKAIYGLNESGKLANIELQAVLATEGYKLC